MLTTILVMTPQLITEVSIVVLMVGTLVGGITQIGEAGATGILYFNPNVTGPIVNGSGRILMVIFVICIVAPLCALKNMRRVSVLPSILVSTLQYGSWSWLLLIRHLEGTGVCDVQQAKPAGVRLPQYI